jgi:hypothetical protein
MPQAEAVERLLRSSEVCFAFASGGRLGTRYALLQATGQTGEKAIETPQAVGHRWPNTGLVRWSGAVLHRASVERTLPTLRLYFDGADGLRCPRSIMLFKA